MVACHEKIRMFLGGLQRVAALDRLDDPRVPSAAEQAHRYFSIGLPLHADDEDGSVAPRLREIVPTSGTLLDELSTDHREIEAQLELLLPLLSGLASGALVDHTRFRTHVDGLRAVLMPHIEREEAELFPLCAAFSVQEREAIATEMIRRRDGIAQ
jgi:hemerythrin-like domain-containing protein